MSNQSDLRASLVLPEVPAAPPCLLLHIVPSFLGEWMQAVELVDLTIEPIGLRLTPGRGLAPRRPFPNKRWAVACRRRGRLAMYGVLLDLDWPVGDLIATARWSVDAKRIVERSVRYRLLDCEFAAASEWRVLWYACSPPLGDWLDRWPTGVPKTGEFSFGPRQEGDFICQGRNIWRLPGRGTFAADDRVVDSEEVRPLPTIEPRRLISLLARGRVPRFADAFRV